MIGLVVVWRGISIGKERAREQDFYRSGTSIAFLIQSLDLSAPLIPTHRSSVDRRKEEWWAGDLLSRSLSIRLISYGWGARFGDRFYRGDN